MYKAIFFDLDGTLTDSGEGITKSVQYALEKIGKPEPDLQKLRIFVGPPLLEQFEEYAGIDEETARKAAQADIARLAIAAAEKIIKTGDQSGKGSNE